MITTLLTLVFGAMFIVAGIMEKTAWIRFLFVLVGAVIITTELVKIWRLLW